jgi:hypothetical protein
MNGKKYKDALPCCACGCGQKVRNFRARYLPGHHTKELKGERNSFFGKTHNAFAKSAISEGLRKINERN